MTAYTHAFRSAILFGPIWGAWVGLLLTWQIAPGLRMFSGEKLIPLLVAMSVLRQSGAQAALSATVLAGTVSLHRAGRRDPVGKVDHGRGAMLLGLTVPILYAPVSTAALLASAGWLNMTGEGSPVFAGARDPEDALLGMALAVALGIGSVPAWLLAGARLLAPTSNLASKLLGAVLALVAASFVTTTLADMAMRVLYPAGIPLNLN